MNAKKTSIPLYKIIAMNGTGGYSDFVWPLPSAEKPSKWVSVKGELSLCKNGLHATTNYKKWWQNGGRIFLFEPRGSFLSDSCSKICYRSGRLVREITLSDPLIKLDKTLMAWVMLGIFQRKENIDIFSGADLHGADLHGADLSGADLSGADLSGANLSGANLRDANLRDANLRDANLHGANLHGANLHYTDLSGADLRGADLRGADLRSADLRFADLHGADLSGADLSGADLHGADLHGADLSGADLRGADLSSANLRDANLRSAYRPENDLNNYK